MSRDIKLLHPKLQIIFPKFLMACNNDKAFKAAKVTARLLDCLRNEQEQNSIPSANTKAKYPNSGHNWGTAGDLGLFDAEGNYLEESPLYAIAGRIGKALGLGWGGDWNFIDTPHYYLLEFKAKPSELLIPKYGTPEKFMATWPKGDDEVDKVKIKVKVENIIKDSAVEMVLVDGHLFAPIRFVGENLGYDVDYANNTVNFTKKEGK